MKGQHSPGQPARLTSSPDRARPLHRRRRPPMAQPTSYQRQVARLLLAGAMLVLAGLVAPTVGKAGASSTAPHQAAIGPGPSQVASCPTGATCVTIPADCPTGQTCPEVIALNPTGLADGQALQLELENFPTKSGDVALLKYCSNPTKAVYPPICSFDNVFGGDLLPSTVVVSPTGGSAVASFQVQSDPTGPGQTAILASQGSTEVPGFFCDNGPDFCSVDVELSTLGDEYPDSTAKNMAIIPISFAVPNTGCDPSTPTLTAEQSWTAAQLLTAVNQVACVAKPPVLALGVSNDSESVAADVANGTVQIGFTDDPEDPVSQSALPSSKFALIPVAVSATVMAVEGAVSSIPSPLEPDSRPVIGSWNLTPNEVAGVLTGYYNHIQGDDNTSADTVSPAQAPWCNPGPCSVLDEINPQPEPFNLATGTELGSYFYASYSGSTDQVTSWFCGAPNVPLTIDGKSWTDPNTASSTFTTNNGLDPGVPWPITKCQTYEELGSEVLTPKIQPIVPQVLTGDSPADVATSMNKWNANNEAASVPHSDIAFGLMDSSQAAFFGYVDSNLQNAAGNFVAPTAASVDAALAEAGTNPDGTVADNYNPATPDPNAYPMPMVTYAVVPTAPQSATQAGLVKSLLYSLLSVTGGSAASSLPGGSHASDLPDGYYPLPTALFDEAVKDVNSDIHVPASTTTTTRATTSTSLVGTPANPSTPTGSGTGPSSPSSPAGSTPSGSVPASSGRSPTLATTPSSPATNLTGFAFQDRQARWLLVGLLVAAAAALLFGPALLAGAFWRTKRVRRASHG